MFLFLLPAPTFKMAPAVYVFSFFFFNSSCFFSDTNSLFSGGCHENPIYLPLLFSFYSPFSRFLVMFILVPFFEPTALFGFVIFLSLGLWSRFFCEPVWIIAFFFMARAFLLWFTHTGWLLQLFFPAPSAYFFFFLFWR